MSSRDCLARLLSPGVAMHATYIPRDTYVPRVAIPYAYLGAHGTQSEG